MESPAESGNYSLVFGKYQVIRRLAIGGMGEIFLARQIGVAGFDRLAILKSLLPDLALEESFVSQFLDEARVAATLNHPNVVSVYEVGQWEGIYFIAMEYIRGENLARLLQKLIKEAKKMPCTIAAKIVHDAALGLEHAHSAVDTEGRPINVVHRDIGLHNIMVRVDGVTKVVDFGIAKAANRSTRTRTGILKGKLQYMSPEQVGQIALDGRSDQFSLGVVLWELITQTHLFRGENDLSSMQKLLSDPIPKPSAINSDVPPELEAVIMRMLERDRNNRYPSCRDVAADLARFLDQSGATDNQTEVAALIEKTLGQDLAESTRDLTPSGTHNFFTSFSAAGGQNGLRESPTLNESVFRPEKKSLLWMLFPLAAVILAVGATWVFRAQLWSGFAPPKSRIAAPKLPTPMVAPLPATVPTPAKEVVVLNREPVPKERKDPITRYKRPAAQPAAGETAPEAKAANGFLTVRTDPWVKISIGEKRYGSTPLFKLELPSGVHRIRFSNEEFGIDKEQVIKIRPGQTEKLDLDFMPK